MPWIEFQATEIQILSLFETIFRELDCELFESYSEPNTEIKRFNKADKLSYLIKQITLKRELQFSLWIRNIMSEPQTRTIHLKSSGFRFAIDGSGLFSFQLNLSKDEKIIHSKIGYFTEVGAMKKYSGLNKSESVNWNNHKLAIKVIRKLVSAQVKT